MTTPAPAASSAAQPTDATAATVRTGKAFPPHGFTLVSKAPRFWEPGDGDCIQGHAVDVREDAIGIILTADAYVAEGKSTYEETRLPGYPEARVLIGVIGTVLYIPTKAEEIASIASQMTETPVPDPRDPTKTLMEMRAGHVAIQWDADTEHYSVAFDLTESEVPTIDAVLVRIMNLRQAAVDAQAKKEADEASAKAATAVTTPPVAPTMPAPPEIASPTA